jgi:3-octaprenyl-4-hydroxybenzoate carboxy-lyase
VDDFAIAGGLHGAPVELARCRTVDLEVPARAELVLEGELLPIGWTADKGPFGEFSHMSGEVKWNPIFCLRAITHRRDPICNVLQMALGERLAGRARDRGRGAAGPARGQRRAGGHPGARRQLLLLDPHRVHHEAPRRGHERAAGALVGGGGQSPTTTSTSTIPTSWTGAMTFRVQADRDVLIVPGGRGTS